jgi:hypothetical protein
MKFRHLTILKSFNPMNHGSDKRGQFEQGYCDTVANL